MKTTKQKSVYIVFLNSKKKYQETKKEFNDYKAAWAWAIANLDNPSKDMINFY